MAHGMVYIATWACVSTAGHLTDVLPAIKSQCYTPESPWAAGRRAGSPTKPDRGVAKGLVHLPESPPRVEEKPL